MALVLADRVKETTSTTGTGTITLAGAAVGFRSFSVIGNGNTTYYAIVDNTTGAWEVGVGTYTSSGTTLARTTILSSSNSNNAVDFAAGSKDVFVTYPSEKSVFLNASDVVAQQSFGAITATSAALTTGTISTAPSSSTDIVNKVYVDGLVAQGITYHSPVYVESPESAGNLNATYSNGTAGVGATLTNAGTQVALTIDGVLMTVGKRVLIYNQTNAAHNGIYTVTTVGDGSTNWVLTRATDADSYGLKDPDALGQGDAIFVTNGATGAGETYVVTTSGTITFGTTAITFAQISDASVYTSSNGVTLNGVNIELTPTGTAGTYGSASAVPVLVTNAYGQVTGVTNTNIAISGSAVSGNISGSAGSVANALTLGSYLTGTSFNGSSAVTAAVDATSANTGSKVVARDSSGNFSAGTITAALSGNATTATSATTATNLSGGSAGTIPYQSASGTTVQLAAGTSGYYLKSNGAAAPSWAAVSSANDGTLTLAVSGTGLSGSASFTANQAGASSFTVTSNATNANTGSTIVARDASGNFSAGTITATLNGNASTATSATSASTATSATTATTATTANALNTANNYQVNSLGVGTGASGTAGEIRAISNVIGFYSSDIKFKENIRNIPNAAATAAAIGGKLFDWTDSYISDNGGEDGYFIRKADFGVIAQHALKHFPLSVRTRPDGSLAVDYEKLSALALAANAEHEERILKLEALVSKLIEN